MNFKSTADFEKEFKRLEKKFKSLSEDLNEFKKVIGMIPLGNSKHFATLHEWTGRSVVKARLACRYLQGGSRLRVIYSYHKESECIEFIEIYFKGEKENEDRARIQQYIKDHS